uniref:Transposase n=1 Tax=Acrobeloides nanus TaxID=290746 RepID=A0A914D5R3_9BILA
MFVDDPRTNNSIEGYHHKLKLVMKHGHSTLWTFISMLREFDETIYSDLRQWDNGLEPPGRKLWMMVQARKLRLVNKWDEVTRIEYLRSIASTLDNDI